MAAEAKPRPKKRLTRVPMREQDPEVRNHNFEEVNLGYNKEEAIIEASRCLNCKDPQCVQGCPVSAPIPQFIQLLKEGKFEESYKTLSQDLLFPCITGRVCPQERQCEGSCILNKSKKVEPISIGNLERFVGRLGSREQDLPTIRNQRKWKTSSSYWFRPFWNDSCGRSTKIRIYRHFI